MNDPQIMALIYCVLALTFAITLQSPLVNSVIAIKGHLSNYWVVARRIIGAVVLTVTARSSLGGFALLLHPVSKTDLLIALTAVLILLPACAYMVKKTPQIGDHYPQLQFERWNTSLYILNSFSWLIYMSGFELCARIAVLSLLAPHMHPAAAILFMSLVNGLVHIPKGRQESLGAIPFSMLIGTIYLITGSFAAIVFIHTLFATVTEYYVVRSENKNNKITV
ncbi:MAG TPA: CPBP family intramembrane glutamic endopeptidase [Bacteroidia bacterium]|nr:CPBP family intramembrane glutamic endopeptidase [Bacteroidia bacterium]